MKSKSTTMRGNSVFYPQIFTECVFQLLGMIKIVFVETVFNAVDRIINFFLGNRRAGETDFFRVGFYFHGWLPNFIKILYLLISFLWSFAALIHSLKSFLFT